MTVITSIQSNSKSLKALKSFNKTPCTACRDLHKKCDASEGFPCKGCKFTEAKAWVCRPTTKQSKKIKVNSKFSANPEQGSGQMLLRARTSAPKPSIGSVQAHSAHFSLDGVPTDENNQETPMSQAFHQQYSPFFQENEHEVCNMHEGKPLIRESKSLSFMGGPTQVVPTHSSNAEPLTGYLMDSGADHPNIVAQADGNHPQVHDAFWGLYDEQAMFLPGNQFCQYRFSF